MSWSRPDPWRRFMRPASCVSKDVSTGSRTVTSCSSASGAKTLEERQTPEDQQRQDHEQHHPPHVLLNDALRGRLASLQRRPLGSSFIAVSGRGPLLFSGAHVWVRVEGK